ncbi:hypothetical protein niasHT_028396 [Heterodera trifolii]|uniref:Uncharacterized protein n=1 Tax=Heterodera trifolii TaxID=157864 RepID=A0ABD2JII5_9BILA
MAAPSIRLITTSKAPAATGYSQAVLVNNQTLYVSGQTGMISGKTDVVPGGARAEAKQAMTNIGEILTYAGSSFKHVINCNIMVTNMNDFQDVNETFKNFFTADTYPARSFFQVVKLPKNALVMIDAVAVVAGHYRTRSYTAWGQYTENVTKKTVLQKRISMNNFEAVERKFDVLSIVQDNYYQTSGQSSTLTIPSLNFSAPTKQIWDRMGTKLELYVYSYETEDNQRIWDVFCREIWPTFATNIRRLYFSDGDHLDNLRRRTLTTFLTDLDQLNSIQSDDLFPDGIADDGPNATARQALSKWLHTPSKNGQPKRLFCDDFDEEGNIEWLNSFKEAFARATNSSVSYKIKFAVCKTSIEPFELENERTKEKLTLEKVARLGIYWL